MPVDKEGKIYIISADLRWLLQKILSISPKQARGIVGPKWKSIVAATSPGERLEINRVERKVGGKQRDIVQYGILASAFVAAAAKAGIAIRNFDAAMLPKTYPRSRSAKGIELDFSSLK